MSYTVVTKPGCPHCDRAKNALKIRKLIYKEDVCDTQEKIDAFKAEGYRSFPMVFHGQSLIGTADQLDEHLKRLDADDDF
jgi:glutaredoxin